MQLSIIIINYNVKHFLEYCLLSVRKAITDLEAEVIVVDNNSSDGSRQFFKSKFPEVTFIWCEENLGFARANNIGYQEAIGKYILFLNPDTIVAEDSFLKCIAYFETHDRTGALGVRMIDGSGKFLKESKRSFPDPMTSLFKLSGLSSVFPSSKIVAKYYVGHVHENETTEVDVIAGAFMMIPKRVLSVCGLFDERFFMYGEDIDLSYRIQLAGFVNIYFADTSIVHFKGESTKRGTLNYVKMFYTAMHIFVKKHYKSVPSRFYSYFIEAAIGIRAGVALCFRMMRKIISPIRRKNINDTAGRLLLLSTTKHTCESLELQLLNEDHYSFEHLIMRQDDQNLTAYLAKKNISQLVVLVSGYDYSYFIDIIQKLGDKIKVSIYAYGASSIIGSDDKHNSGEIITLTPKKNLQEPVLI